MFTVLFIVCAHVYSYCLCSSARRMRCDLSHVSLFGLHARASLSLHSCCTLYVLNSKTPYTPPNYPNNASPSPITTYLNILHICYTYFNMFLLCLPPPHLPSWSRLCTASQERGGCARPSHCRGIRSCERFSSFHASVATVQKK